MNDSIVIASAARTPIGGFMGGLSSLTAPELGGVAIRAAIERSGLPAGQFDGLFMGCVLTAGLGQAPARQAALNADMAVSTPCTTVSKVCGSGMQAVFLAHDLLLLGRADAVVAGGMESMSNAPYLLPKARNGYRMGHGQVMDHTFLDGLEDSYSADNRGRLMGTFAEDCATRYAFSRGAQDAFSIESTQLAKDAISGDAFQSEIAPVATQSRETTLLVSDDEQPFKARIDKIASLRPAFRRDGTVTAANSSSISDGAAALTLMRRSDATTLGVTPLARIVGLATHAQEPEWFTTAPVGAIRKLLATTGWSVGDVDLWEINEAFAVVPMAAMHELDISRDRVNVNGGACALGHPIGASGARIIVTLIHALQRRRLKRGIATLCIGGGEATALAVEIC